MASVLFDMTVWRNGYHRNELLSARLSFMLTEDEARRLADQCIEDVAAAADVDEAMSVYQVVNERGDFIRVGSHLVGPLTDAVNLYLSGDRSQRTVNLTALAKAIDAATE